MRGRKQKPLLYKGTDTTYLRDILRYVERAIDKGELISATWFAKTLLEELMSISNEMTEEQEENFRLEMIGLFAKWAGVNLPDDGLFSPEGTDTDFEDDEVLHKKAAQELDKIINSKG